MKFLLASVLVLFISVPAYIINASAQEENNNEISAEEADLRKILSEFIENAEINMKKRDVLLKQEGEININDMGSYYTVTLPDIKIIDPKKKSITKIGKIALNASSENDNWKMAIAIPSPIITKNSEGKKLNQIDIEKQKFVGVYNPIIKNFSKLGISYDDVIFSDIVENSKVEAKNISVVSDLQIDEDTLSGPTYIVLKNITFKDDDAAKSMSVDEVNMSVEYDGLDILSLAQGNYDVDMNKIGGMKLSAEIKDIESGFKLENMRFEFEGKKPENGFSDSGLNIEYSGLEPNDTKDMMVQFIPRSMNFDINFNQLPVSDLFELGVMQADSKESPAAAMGILQAITLIPIKMAKAGSNLEIEHIDFENDMYQIKTRGKIHASGESPLMAVGGVVMSATGLDKTKTALNNSTPNASEKQKKSIQNILKRIDFIETNCGQQEDIINSYKCHLEFSRDGQIKLNGKSMKPMEALQAVK